MIKEKLYDFFVRKHEGVRYEYERYVREHLVEHYENHGKHRRILAKLIWHYRVKRAEGPMLYFDNANDIQQNNGITPNADNLQDKNVNQKSCDSEKKVQSVKSDNKKSNVQNVAKKQVNTVPETKKENSINLPYLQGAESRAKKWIPPQDLVRTLMDYDVISFDIFDTLIFRPFDRPREVFEIVGAKLNILDFANIRLNAEKKVREENYRECFHREAPLRDIYARIADEIGLDAEIGMNCELEVEESLFFSNPYMKYVFDTIKAQGKRIILVSDMYISANELQRMITKCGYIGYEKMFVSCDYSCSKRDGKLYYIVNKYLNDDDIKVIHVGDNAVSDIKMADKYGMATYLYENVNAKGKEYRPTDMSLLVGGAYRGIVNSHIHNGYKRYDAYYEYGFTYGGLFMLGYAQYIHRYALEHKIDKVLFVARDGYIIKKVYDMFFSDIKSEYMLCSRISNLKMAAYCSKNDFLKEFVLRWDKEKKNISIRDVLENMDLLDMIEMLPVFVNVEDSMDEENTKIIYKFICDNWNYVINKYEKYINLSYKYYRNFLERTRRVLVVDIGWRGQGILALRNLERDYWHFGCEIYGMLAGSAPTKVCTGQLQAGIIDTYMFSPIKNIVSFSFHSKNAINNILTELFAGAPSPSFKGFIEEGDDYSLAFDVPEIANYELISKIHEGIVDFVKMYAGCFESYDFMYEISGEDAYMPIKHIFKDYSFIKRFLGKYEFQDCVGGTSGESLRKVSDVFKKFNL